MSALEQADNAQMLDVLADLLVERQGNDNLAVKVRGAAVKIRGLTAENARLRLEVEGLRRSLAETDPVDCECPACNQCAACLEANAKRICPRDCRVCAGTCRSARRRAALGAAK